MAIVEADNARTANIDVFMVEESDGDFGIWERKR